MNTELPKYLLAKSYPQDRFPHQPPDYALLLQHNRDVAQACTALVEVIGQLVLERTGLTGTDIEAFKKAMAAVGWFEDLGKANSHFQKMVTGAPQLIQLLRHETLSGLLLWQNEELRQWLEPALGDWFVPALWAAMGHHRKFDGDTQASEAPALTIWLNHPDFRQMLLELGKSLGMQTLPPTFSAPLIIAPDNRNPNAVSARRALQDLKEDFAELRGQLALKWSKRLAVMKALGIAADVAASAVAAQGQSAANYSLDTFVRQTLGQVGLDAADFDRLIGEWAWKSTGRKRPSNAPQLPPGFAFRPFQCEVAASESSVTLACAGCGSGKSLAAYLWAQAWQRRTGQTNFRLFFCLPTTGTTTEHFKDYALEAGFSAALTHSRSTVDLKALAETADQESDVDASNAERAAQRALDDLRDKIESLALWDTPLVVATADTVLGLMANARRSLYAFPAIAISALVFDEIHAFDDRLFGHLLAFLRFFPRQPVLLMTASLPQHRLAALQKVRPDLQIVAGPPEYEQLPRYELRRPGNPEEVWQAVADCIAQGGKVLWVRNRVEWANETYTACRERFPGVEVNVYHSRFRYKDRSRLHHYVIGKFKGTDAQILVTTQVAEMSLDLSADLLITDIASVPALIQRMGRANRRSTPECPQPPKPVLVCPLPLQADERDNPALPYDAEDIAAAELWIERLLSLERPLSQRDLADAFGSLSPGKDFDVEQAWEAACFVSGGWETRPGMTRGEGYTVNVILEADWLEADWKAYSQSEPGRDWLIEHEVAIPFRSEVLRWGTVGSRRLAPAERVAYDFNPETKKGTGARWVSAQPATNCQIL
ncbi:CRISPR-associated helicase Cas3' [Chloracidobacterium thermophilum]|uniref:CRISPR-associated helicase Cas3' n=1 Tax=Chloracidobacterium thermophilum TaxID=458033 RepID=UPI0007388805|nr:CRISPR-associated helicase Cas3' [Chloracidobacterium thermophilum]